MVQGIFLIKWDEVLGGKVYMKYPENLEIPENIIQQIQISHNFSESYIITEEKEWNSVSFYNAQKEIVIVIILDKFDEGNDYLMVLEEFNEELNHLKNEENLKDELKRFFKFSLNVFRTRDEVISKLSNEVAELKMRVYDFEKKFETILNSDHLTVKSRILLLLIRSEELTLEEIKQKITTSASWLKKVVENLVKNNIVLRNIENDTYYINF